MHKNIIISRDILKYVFGTTFTIIGLDQVFHTDIIAGWERYMGPLALILLPINSHMLLNILGTIEVIIGTIFFTRFSRVAGYFGLITMTFIIVDLLSLRFFDMAIQDTLIALSLYVFLLLTIMTEREKLKKVL